MNPKNAALFVSVVGALVTTAGGCLELKASNSETTGGQGGSANGGQGGAGAGQGSASSSSNGSSSSGGGSSNSSSSSSNSSSSGQGGNGGSCMPNEDMTCYPGPPETKSKGTCTAGQMTCNGGVWSACNGLVLPMLEQCDSAKDTDCDGRIGCQGVPTSSATLGDIEDDAIISIATGVGVNGFDGAAYGAGYRNANLAADGTVNSAQVLFVKRNPLGDLVDWSDKFNIDASGNAYARGLAVSPKEDVAVVGTYQNGSLSIGGQGQKATGSATLGFLASFTAMGTLQFAKPFGTDGTTIISDVGVDSEGNIYIGGKFDNGVDFGNGLVVASAGIDGFVASYTNTGMLRWRQIFSGPGNQSVESLSVDTLGTLYTATHFTTLVNVPGGPMLSADGGTDVVITAFNPSSGTVKWNNQIGGSGDVVNTEITSRAGNIALVAAFRGSIDVGPWTYQSMDGPSTLDTVVATLDSGGGAASGTYAFVANGNQVGLGITLDSFGDIVLDGYFSTKLPFNGVLNDLTTGGDTNAFVVKFDSALNPRWAHGYGNSLIQAFLDVAVEPTTGHIFVGGGFQGLLLQFGLTIPQSEGGYDAIIGVMSN